MASRATLQSRAQSPEEQTQARRRLCEKIEDDFPVPWDWLLQDGGPGFPEWFSSKDPVAIEQKLILRVLSELGGAAGELRREFNAIRKGEHGPNDARRLELYAKACEQRRAQRLRTVLAQSPKIIFTRHRTLRPSFFAYTEGQSDAQDERHFLPGSSLCLLEMDGLHGKVRTLIEDRTGAMRDPAVSWDAQRVLFAWKKSLNDDDYHLYELNLASGQIRQITTGLGFADYEGCYLPNGDLMFASTRCVQTVDCWWTEVSNLYTCDPDGKFLRRLGFDQVHAIHPAVMDDGRVIYTRWDYNDRGQIFPQALFQMNPDGTGQAEFYGNNSWFPTTIAHARGIPGTQKVVAIFAGHHTAQTGKLGILDPAKGRQENSGAQLIAPIRATPAERIDAYGQNGELFQYPYPLSETEFLVTYSPLGWQDEGSPGHPSAPARFSLYWMNLDGRRELLASDPDLPCNQPVPLVVRTPPPQRPSLVDYHKTTGTYYVQDVYAGPGLQGMPRGTIERLRVVALAYRAAGVGDNSSGGPGGGALVSTPIAIGNGSWDVKVVLGDAKVHADGSAFFTVPARTPTYFQALDAKGQAVQTMRSWSTLQPGENQACVGCHEAKNSAPPTAGYRSTLALQAGPQALEPFYGPPRGFSFTQEIQPILDRHCIVCHHDRDAARQRFSGLASSRRQPAMGAGASTNSNPTNGAETAFSLLGADNVDRRARRKWSDAYLVLTQSRPDDRDPEPGRFRGDYRGRLVNWIGSQSVPTLLPPYFAGAANSELIRLLDKGHKKVTLSREEMDKLACWIDLLVPYCSDYTEANAWSEAESQKYQHFLDKRRRMEALEQKNIEALAESLQRR